MDNFQNIKTIRSFGEDILGGKITITVADEKQSNLKIIFSNLMIKIDQNQNQVKRKKEILKNV